MNSVLHEVEAKENFFEPGFDKENCKPNLPERALQQIHEAKHTKVEKKSHIFRICLTGGPCAGKTTAIAKL